MFGCSGVGVPVQWFADAVRMDQLLEVCGYLRDVKVEVRAFAAQTIAEYSSNEEAQQLLLASKTLVKDLCLLISDGPVRRHLALG